MTKLRVWAFLLLIIGAGIGYLDYYSEQSVNASSPWYKPFKLGLDLRGGSQLTYQADLAKILPADVDEAMASLRSVIERRVNSVGLTEAAVRTEHTQLGGDEHRLIVEIPGVLDVNQAVSLINKTPSLEFKVERPAGAEKEAIARAVAANQAIVTAKGTSTEVLASLDPVGFEDPDFVPTDLTGQYLKRATLELSQGNQATLGPTIGIEFNKEGGEKFAQITKNNVGKRVGIFLDGILISAPTVREEIRNGQAQISGEFTLDGARSLVRDLNLGALPVPIKLVSTETIGATLGQEAFDKGIKATGLGFLVIALFMILWYRLPGVISVLSLSIYLSLIIALFKVLNMTLTAGGIAGLILSIGIAVDANVLVFERMKEELRRGKSIRGAIQDGFSRAWTSIRDSNVSTIITALILFWFGTAVIKGFAINLAFGVTISMVTAIVLSRTLLMALRPETTATNRFLFGSGLFTPKQTNSSTD